MDGKMVDWDDANVHVLTHALHYGYGVFEGIRCYRTHDGKSAIFRLREHMERLLDSAKITMIKPPFKIEELMKASREIFRVNNLKEGYLRPVMFVGHGAMGLFAVDNPVRTAIACWPWGAYLGEEGLDKGIRVKISSFSRHHVNSGMAKAKICGNYVNSIMAKLEAKGAGFDEALLLDTEGYVAEGSGENFFMLRKGKLKTPPTTSILEGITRDTIITLAGEQGLEVLEGRITRDEAYTADEAFFTGTAAEITPIREIDGRPIGAGKSGPATKKLQKMYFDTVHGKVKKHLDWLDYV